MVANMACSELNSVAQDRLNLHICAIALYIDNFCMDVCDIGADLKLDQTRFVWLASLLYSVLIKAVGSDDTFTSLAVRSTLLVKSHGSK